MYQRLKGVTKSFQESCALATCFAKRSKKNLSLEFQFDNFSYCSASSQKGLLFVLKILGYFDIIIIVDYKTSLFTIHATNKSFG